MCASCSPLGVDFTLSYGSGPIPGGIDPSYFAVGTSPLQTQQFSFGGIVKDLGDFIVTTAGETLKVFVDAFGRRIVQKTGEVLAGSPVGPSTAWAYANQQGGSLLSNPVVWLGGGLVLLAIAMRR